jgi:hypothetical protein
MRLTVIEQRRFDKMVYDMNTVVKQYKSGVTETYKNIWDHILSNPKEDRYDDPYSVLASYKTKGISKKRYDKIYSMIDSCDIIHPIKGKCFNILMALYKREITEQEFSIRFKRTINAFTKEELNKKKQVKNEQNL